MNIPTVQSLTAFCLLLGPAVALAGSIPGSVIVPVTQQHISISINSIEPEQHWAVALEPQDGPHQMFVVPESVLSVEPRPGVQGSGLIQPIQVGYQIADSSFQISHPLSPSQSLLLDVQLPAGVSISIVKEGNVVFAGIPAAPMLLLDGKLDVSSQHPALRAKALLMLASVAVADEVGPDLRADNQGATPQASTAGLRRHLLSLPPIATSLDGQAFSMASGRIAAVLTEIHIDTVGKVTDCRVLRGDDPLASASCSALLRATFRPFVQNGDPVSVVANVTYSLSDGGKNLRASIR